MRIEPNAQRVAARTPRRAPSPSPGFALSDPPPEAATPGAAAPAPPAFIPPALETLARNSPEPDPAQQDRRAAGHGRALLGALAGLQLSALGPCQVQARRTLADLARVLPRATDPGLDAVLQAIAQRAAIELARSE